MQPGRQVLSDELPGFVLGALREGTAALHAETERHPLLRTLLSPALTTRDLALLLCGFREFFALVEPLVPQRLPAELRCGAYVYYPRLPLLEADLADLTADLPVPPGMCRELAIATPGNILGILYVIEGATQGGRVIAPHLGRHLGFNAHWGARYFHLHRRRQWLPLRALLAQPGLQDMDGIVSAGRETFRLLHQVLDQISITRQAHGQGG